MRDRFVRHLRRQCQRYGVALAVFCLAWGNLHIGENFPFSDFPMFGNPSPGVVDYYFLTDARGNPLAAIDLAGVSAPAIKKMVARRVKDEIEASKPARVDKFRGSGVDRAALAVLEKLQRDAVRRQPRDQPWPPGVQLHQALIESTPRGFRESFRRVAQLPDTGRQPPAAAPVAKRQHDDVTDEDATRLQRGFSSFYLGMLAVLIALLMTWNKLPDGARGWCSAGGGRGRVGHLEALCLRAALAVVLWQALQARVYFDSLPHPQGLATVAWIRPILLWLGVPENWERIRLAAVPLLFWYVCGWGQFIPLTGLTLAHILQRTLFASQGATHHGHQLLSLVFCAQTIVAWGIFCGRVAGSRRGWTSPANHTAIWRAVVVVVAAAYVTSAGYKLIASDGRWLLNSHHLSAQVVKTYRQNYYNHLDPQYLSGVPPAPLVRPDPTNDRYRHPIPAQAQWILAHPHLARSFFGLGFCVELLAFLAPFNRGLASGFGIALVAFHWLVWWLMRLDFPLNAETVWVVLVNLPGWLIWWRTGRSEDETPGG